MKNSQATVLAVIIVLGVLAVCVVGGGIYLAANDKTLPGELIAIGSAAAGAIAGLLAKTGTEGPEPQPVVGVEGGPVVVAPAKPRKRVAGQAGQVTPGVLALVLVVAVIVYLLVR